MNLVIDTNVFVAASFNPHSSSATIVQALNQGHHTLVCNQPVFHETRHILSKIPPVNWPDFEPLFTQTGQYQGQTRPEQFAFISDPADRKFAALAAASRAILITNDQHLLAHRQNPALTITTPSNFLHQFTPSAR
jgi:predicted nucleic acid-binding protein